MAYPTPSPQGQHPGSVPGPSSGPLRTPRSMVSPPRCQSSTRSPAEGEHQLEKLQFALAVALTRGDHTRSQQLRDQIAALGEDLEEPGT